MILFIFLFDFSLAAETISGSLAKGPHSDGQKLKLTRGACPTFWFNFKGRCYRYFGTEVTWGEAELVCVSEGANLVSIHSLECYNFVNYLIKNFDFTQSTTWIGLTDLHLEGGWIWFHDSKYKYSLWQNGQPDNYHQDQTLEADFTGTMYPDLKKDTFCLRASHSISLIAEEEEHSSQLKFVDQAQHRDTDKTGQRWKEYKKIIIE